MMAPDYAHWHGMFEVAQRFYEEFIPQAEAICEKAEKEGKKDEAAAARKTIDEVLSRPEHEWYLKNKPAKESMAGP